MVLICALSMGGAPSATAGVLAAATVKSLDAATTAGEPNVIKVGRRGRGGRGYGGRGYGGRGYGGRGYGGRGYGGRGYGYGYGALFALPFFALALNEISRPSRYYNYDSYRPYYGPPPAAYHPPAYYYAPPRWRFDGARWVCDYVDYYGRPACR
jgi:hypothetical protein